MYSVLLAPAPLASHEDVKEDPDRPGVISSSGCSGGGGSEGGGERASDCAVAPTASIGETVRAVKKMKKTMGSPMPMKVKVVLWSGGHRAKVPSNS